MLDICPTTAAGTVIASKPQWNLLVVRPAERVILCHCIQKQDMALRGDPVFHKALLETFKSEFIRVHVFILMSGKPKQAQTLEELDR